MLKFKRSHTSSQASDFSISSPRLDQQNSAESSLRRKCSFVTSQLGYSKASVVLKNLSLPLAWPVEEYFGNKKEWREFTVQLVLRSGEGREVFSKPMERINRTYTDLDFPDTFVFPDQGPEFCIELLVYCRRTDENAEPGVVRSLSRSLGRSIGQSLKWYMRSNNGTVGGGGNGKMCGGGAPNRHFLEELQGRSGQGIGTITGSSASGGGLSDVPEEQLEEYIENWRNPEKMCAIGSARFRIKNATLTGRTHTYNLERIPQNTHPNISPQQLLPIYGNICAQLLVQPTSLGAPLAQGILDIFYVEGGLLLQRLFCVLQGGSMKCYDEEDALGGSLKSTPRVPALTLPINENTVIESTAFQTALRLKLTSPEEQKPRHFLCISDTQNAFLGWRNALNLQVLDCSMWSDFALSQRNPHAASFDLNTDANIYLSPFPSPGPKADEPQRRPRVNSSASMILAINAIDKRTSSENKDQWSKCNDQISSTKVQSSRINDRSKEKTHPMPFAAKTTAIPRPSVDPRYLTTASLPYGRQSSGRSGRVDVRKTVRDYFEHNLPSEPHSTAPILEANEDELEPQAILTDEQTQSQRRNQRIDETRVQNSTMTIHQEPINYVISLKIGDSPAESLSDSKNGIRDSTAASTRRSSTTFSNSTTTSASSTGAKTQAASFALNAFPNVIPVNPSTPGSSNGTFGSESPRIYQFEALRNYNTPITSKKSTNVKDKPNVSSQIGNGAITTGQGRTGIGRAETWHFVRKNDQNHHYNQCTRL